MSALNIIPISPCIEYLFTSISEEGMPQKMELLFTLQEISKCS
jgi:hypothetical protein